MIYIIYLQRFTSVHLIPKFDLIYINIYNFVFINIFIICLVQRIDTPCGNYRYRKTVLLLLLYYIILYSRYYYYYIIFTEWNVLKT